MTVLIDPTSACNLKYTGCWAAEYGFNADTTAVRISPHRQSFDLAMGVDRADIGKGGTFRLLVWMLDTSDKGGRRLTGVPGQPTIGAWDQPACASTPSTHGLTSPIELAVRPR